ncbi:lysophospholipid acyltransferase family protein [Desulfatiferula olefinivorans]
MRLVNAPKAFFVEYRQKHAGSRFISIDEFKETVLVSLRPLVWFAYQPYKWLFLAPLLATSTVCLASLVLVTSLVSTRFARYFAVFWARINSFFTPMTVRVHGREHIDPGQSYVIVANHQSLYDIYVLYGWLGVDFKWVMKKELERVPALGPACKALGHIFIDRSNTVAAVASINAAREKINGGTSVVFFPEGSRSADGKTGAFKKGAFKMALDLGLPVLPITLSGTGKILQKGTTNLMPGTADMIIHPPIPVAPYTEKTITKLMAKARGRIMAGRR